MGALIVLLSFLGKRVMLLAVILATTTFLVRGFEWYISLGILTGAIVAIYKVRLLERLFSYLFEEKQKVRLKSVLINVFSQTLSFILLLVSILADIRFFVGVTVGLLLMSAVICIYGIMGKAEQIQNRW